MAEIEGIAVFPDKTPSRRQSNAAPCLIITAAWLGMVIGLIEVGFLLIEKYRNQVSLIGSLRLNRHYPWMIPLGYLIVFGGCGLVLELLRRARPELARRIAPMVLGVLSLLALLVSIRALHTLSCFLLACGIASIVVSQLRWLTPRFSKLVRYSFLPMALALLLLIVACHAQLSWAEHQATAKPILTGAPNVLFIVLDTVRAKSLSLYGYSRETSPRIDQMARAGVKFDQARSAAPWTLPSHATMFTGRWPSELFKYHEQRLDPSIPTIAGFLGKNGYATAGFVANTFYCNSGFGLSNGFDHYEDFYENFDVTAGEVFRNAELGRRIFEVVGEDLTPRSDGRKDADQINADFLDWLPTCGGRPFFAFLNYLDAHAPYITPPRAERHFGLRPSTVEDFRVLHAWQGKESLSDDPRENQLALDNYDDCIAYLDAALGRLFDELARKGVLENTLIVITADHGESHGEHNLVGHGRSLYGDELHVPLIIVKPGLVPSGKVVAEPVSLRDLPATIADLVEMSTQAPFPGRSLLPLWAQDGSGSPEVSVVRSEAAIRKKSSRHEAKSPALRGPMVSVVAEGMSYIRNADDQEELYLLADDPRQVNDLADVANFRPALERIRAIAGPTCYP
jgi:arylsulfatase A-like enzyme